MGLAEDRLANTLLDGVAALREGRHADAVARLRAVCDDRELQSARDLRDVRARALSLLAQALLHTGETREAEARAEAALRHVRALGDTEGIAEVTALLAEIRERASKAAAPDPEGERRLLEASVDAILGTRDPGLRAETLLRKATAELSAGRAEDALASARAAWTEGAAAGRDRVVVLARICAAHAEPAAARAHLDAALEVADASPEAEQLLAPVARAVEVLGLGALEGSVVHVGGRA